MWGGLSHTPGANHVGGRLLSWPLLLVQIESRDIRLWRALPRRLVMAM